jgi:hypothetical protein
VGIGRRADAWQTLRSKWGTDGGGRNSFAPNKVRLTGEREASATQTPHLTAAERACRAFGQASCQPAKLRAMADHFAKQRPE